MKKSTEIRKSIADKTAQIEVLRNENNIEKAYILLDEIKNEQKELELVENLENIQQTLFNGKELKIEGKADKEKINAIFNKRLKGNHLTDEELEILNQAGTPGQVGATSEKGGYLLPTEGMEEIKELRRNYKSLKDLTNVVKVHSRAGSMPMETEVSNTLTNFEELNEIGQSDIDFGQVKWELKDYGDIVPISNTLLNDENVNLIPYIKGRFVKKEVKTDNVEVIKILKTFTKKAGKDYKLIITALNKDIPSACKENAVIITNQSGYDFLDKLEDKNGKPLLQPLLTDPAKMTFKGKTIEVFDDEELSLSGNKIPFFIGDLYEAVMSFEKEGLEIVLSEHAGFTKNATLLRVIKRCDYKKADAKAMVFVEIDTTA